MAVLRRCTIRGVRIIRELSLAFDPSRTVITGPNGSGKTSVLEAVYLAIHGYSFRTRSIRPVVRTGADRLSVTVVMGEDTISLDHDPGPVQRQCTVNGVPARQRDVAYAYPVFAFHHDQLHVVRGAPVMSYRFFNQVLARLFPGYVADLGAARRAVHEKRRLLRKQVENDIISSWNRVLEQYRIRLLEKRQWLVDQLNRELPEHVQVQYIPDHPDHPLDAFLEQEKRRGEVVAGPHLDRYRFLYGGSDVRTYGSSGQQRSVFFLVLAAMGRLVMRERQVQPVLLLDDFDSEFDARHLNESLALISDRFQVVLTTTDDRRFSSRASRVVRLERGGVIEI